MNHYAARIRELETAFEAPAAALGRGGAGAGAGTGSGGGFAAVQAARDEAPGACDDQEGTGAQRADGEGRELRRMLRRRDKQAGELQAKLRDATARLQLLQRDQQKGGAGPAAAADTQPQRQQETPIIQQDGRGVDQLRAELAATQGAIALLQPSHAQLLARTAELGAAQRAAAARVAEEVAASEAARWCGRVELLEHVSGLAFFWGGRCCCRGLSSQNRPVYVSSS
jgi:hypothetical protein